MESSKRRTIPGSSTFCGWQPLDSNEFTDLFAAQEIIEQNSKLGLSSSKIFKVPHNIEEEAWIYEHFRNFLSELTGFILHFKTCCMSTTGLFYIYIYIWLLYFGIFRHFRML